jgi:formylglycine-generating enzyme required for sulfatase activity
VADRAAPPRVGPGATADANGVLPPNPAEPGRAAPVPPATSNAPATVAARPLPAGFHVRTEAGIHASGWPNQVVSDRDGATMVLIPAGTYIQGRDDGMPEEAPEHKVALAAYYIDQHEVTVRQFKLHLKETGGKPLPARTSAKGEANPSVDDDEFPVMNITAREALAYCDWAGKRLPTEAQWEAAARTPDGRPYPWGANPPVWSRPRTPRQIDPVMSFPLDQSPYGVFDLAGNAWEYTKDFYDPRYYQQFRGQVADNPTGPTSSRSRPPQVVVKGTSKSWLVSGREGLKVDGRFPYVGFRGVLPVEGTTSAPTSPANAPGGGTPPATPGGIVPF